MSTPTSSSPSRLSLEISLNELAEPIRAELAAEIERLDPEKWAFELQGTAGIALTIVSICGRTMRDSRASADEQAVAQYLLAFFHGVFEQSPYIQTLLRREVLPPKDERRSGSGGCRDGQ